MFIIHPGIIEEFITEYKRINHAKTLPDIYANISPYFESSLKINK
jgi:hypothetical protein